MALIFDWHNGPDLQPQRVRLSFSRNLKLKYEIKKQANKNTTNAIHMYTVVQRTGPSSTFCFMFHWTDMNSCWYKESSFDLYLSTHDIRSVYGDCFVFQQDGSHDTVELLCAQTPDFIPPDLRDPNSPDLNSVDYSVWSIMQEKVYQTHIANIDELKHRLVQVCAQMNHRHIAVAIRQWRCHLNACVIAQEQHFEHLLH